MNANQLHVVLRTPSKTLLKTRVCEIEVEDRGGRFSVGANDDTLLTALVPGTIVLRKSDGSELAARIDWGSFTKVGDEARVVVGHVEVLASDQVMPLAV
jgi:F0F1-type ATP synthase epsilon subunit